MELLGVIGWIRKAVNISGTSYPSAVADASSLIVSLSIKTLWPSLHHCASSRHGVTESHVQTFHTPASSSFPFLVCHFCCRLWNNRPPSDTSTSFPLTFFFLWPSVERFHIFQFGPSSWRIKIKTYLCDEHFLAPGLSVNMTPDMRRNSFPTRGTGSSPQHTSHNFQTTTQLR